MIVSTSFISSMFISLFLLINQIFAQSLDQNFVFLNELSLKSKSGILRLNTESYNILMSTPRNYSAFVVLTALASQHQCNPCLALDSELPLVADAYKRGYIEGSDRLFIGVLDFADGKEVFNKLKISNVPRVSFHPKMITRDRQKEEGIVFDMNRRYLLILSFLFIS